MARAELDWLTRDRPTVLIVLPGHRELRRFVLSGAFEVIAKDRRLHFILPADGAESLLAEAGAAVTDATSSRIAVPSERAERWAEVARAAREGQGDAVERTLSGLRPLTAVVDLFDQHAPLYCIAPSSAKDSVSQEVLLACEAEDVSCIVLQAEWDDLAQYRRIHQRQVYVGCWGRQSQEHAKTVQGTERRRVAALGAPHFEGLVRSTDHRGPSRTILLIDPPSNDAGIVVELQRAAGDGRFGNATIVCHETDTADETESFRRLCAADVVLGHVSGLLLASLILEKPTMALGFARTSALDADLRDSGALVWCERADQVIPGVIRLLEPGDAEPLKKARRLLVTRAITRQPGTYAERLAEFCRSSIENQARKQRARRTGAKRDTNSNSYGALLVARRYCGIPDTVDLTVPGHWMHGWLPEYHSLDPLLIAYHKQPGQGEGYDFSAQIRREREDTPQWVGRRDQAEYLLANGYRRVRAIGLPIAYVPKPDVPRVPGSLLVMPPHGHRNHGPDDVVAERYADAIASIAKRFACVYVGVSEDDVAKQQWVESFRRRGIPVFMTADAGDPNTLARLRRILSTFEYVTTNGFGSQIAMAAYCGAKVSVYGPFAEFPRERIPSTHVVKMFPKFEETAWYLCTEEALRSHYPFLFVEPDQAVTREEWGAHEVGAGYTVSAEELRRLFGWEQSLLNEPAAQRMPPVKVSGGR